MTHFKIIGLGLMAGLMNAAVFAEPPVQPGETLESLSKAKVSTTVNGQSGSIQELISSGQIRLAEIQPAHAPSANELPLNPIQADQTAIEQAPAASEIQSAGHETSIPMAADQMSQVAPVPDANAAGADTANLAAVQSAESTLMQEQAAVQAPVAVNSAPNADSALSSAPEAPIADEAIHAAPEASAVPTAQ